MTCVAFIPARSQSKRVPNKNIRPLAGSPLIAYTIHAAIQSEIFSDVFCITDSQEYADIAIRYGARLTSLRPNSTASDSSPDIEWVKWAFEEMKRNKIEFEAFSILRPTSPFRTSRTIRTGWQAFLNNQPADSLRAVQPCSEHPGKMWTIGSKLMHPLFPFRKDGVPWHSRPYSTLPTVYVQDASLEFAWAKTVERLGSIAGESVVPFISTNYEGLDINTEEDWRFAEFCLAEGFVSLPTLKPLF